MIARIIELLRLIYDRPKLNNLGDTFTYVGDDYFDLLFDNASEINEVQLNGGVLPSGIDYELNTETNQFYIDGSQLELSDIINVKYGYTNYSDDELTGYIQEAVAWYNINTGTGYTYDNTDIIPEMDSKQQNLIAVTAMILIEPYKQSYSIPNYKVVYPKRYSKDERIKRTINEGLKTSGSTVHFN